MSLSARRAWIEINIKPQPEDGKESLSARRAWIEMGKVNNIAYIDSVALRKESVDRNTIITQTVSEIIGRSPQGERG